MFLNGSSSTAVFPGGLSRRILLWGAAAIALSSCTTTAKESPVAAEMIVSGGPILTMEGDQPAYVEAVAVSGGRIVFAGSSAEAMKRRGPATVVKDLGGKALLPGFIDSHGHVQAAGYEGIWGNARPSPDGPGDDIPSVIRSVREWTQTPNSQKVIDALDGWIVGGGYDESQLKERRHPTADEADQISKDVPVMLIHASGHLGVVNHKGLEKAGPRRLSTCFPLTLPKREAPRRYGAESDRRRRAMSTLLARRTSPTLHTSTSSAPSSTAARKPWSLRSGCGWPRPTRSASTSVSWERVAPKARQPR